MRAYESVFVCKFLNFSCVIGCPSVATQKKELQILVKNLMSQAKNHLSVICAKEVRHGGLGLDLAVSKAEKRFTAIALKIVVAGRKLLIRGELKIGGGYATTLPEFLIQLGLK